MMTYFNINDEFYPYSCKYPCYKKKIMKSDLKKKNHLF